MHVARAAVARSRAAVDPERARNTARDVLDDERFRDDPTPAPLRRPLQWIGDRLSSAWDATARAVDSLPGPTWLALLAVAILATAIVVWRLVRRRDRIARERRAPTGARAERPDARALDAAADAAERAGDLALAVRLRFRAGLLRLADAGVVTLRPDLTNREVRSSVHAAAFDAIADDFEVVAYSDRPATPEQVDTARRGWSRVLEDARSR
ncbi:MAG TPA: DUF4129 domain-containing protein [Acidimicrobiia bacterium]|nr:DUF4129 domain-containing protein [Acidimicrobiia bacterium]